MHWFRMHHEARNDAKLRHLSDAQFRVWFNLLCYASGQPKRGVIESDDDTLLSLEVAGGDVKLMDETCNVLHALRIVSCVSEGVSRNAEKRFITFLNFEKRQRGGVSRNKAKSTDRVRKYREKVKLRQRETETPGETPVKREETPGDETLKRDETPLDKIRLEEIEDSHTPRARNGTVPSQSQRDAADTLLIREAEALLAADLRTHDVGMKLGRQHNLPGLIEIPGWKWLVAAQKLLGPDISDSARRSLKYLSRIAENVVEADRIAGPNGARPRPSKATERSRKQDEAFERALAELPDPEDD